MTQHIRVERPREGVVVLTLDRPDKLNAMSMALIEELEGALLALRRDPATRALVVTGAGRAFSAGADVGEFTELLGPTPIDAVDGVARYNAVATLLWGSEVPTIAAVNGPAVGGGAALAMLCDLRVIADTAFFKVNQLERGIVPDMGATFLLPRLIGHGRAAQRMLLAEEIGAEEALELGLVSEVAAGEDVLSQALGIAERLAAWAPVGARLTGQSIRAGIDGTLAEALAREATAQASCAGSHGFSALIDAFIGRRDG